MNLRELFLTHQERLLFFIRYGICGATGAGIQVIGLYLWVAVLGLEAQYLWGAVIAYCVAIVVTFFMQKYWTFRNHSRQLVIGQMAWYTTFSFANLGLNAFILYAGKRLLEAQSVDFFHTWYLVVQVLAVLTVAVSSFLSNRYVTFRRGAL